MPTSHGVMTASEFVLLTKMSHTDTVKLINEELKRHMTDQVLSIGFFMINVKPRYNTELMVELLRDAGFSAVHTSGNGMCGPWDYIRVEVPRASKV
jgi:hypothetical protein